VQPGEAILEAEFLGTEVQQVKFLRKETFDFGEQPSLEDYERPELKTVSGDMVDELQEISERKQREEDRIEQLEQELAEKQAEIEDLEDQLEMEKRNTETVDRLAERLIGTANGGDGAGTQALEEIKEEKNARIRELETRNEELEDNLTAMQEEKADLNQRVSELEEYEQAVEHMDELREGVRRMAEALGLDANGQDDQLKQQLDKKNERITELEQQIERLREEGVESVKEARFQDAAEFLENELVAEYVERAAGSSTMNEDHFWDVLTVVAQEGTVTRSDAAPLIDLHKENVGKVMRALADNKVLTVDKDGRAKKYSLNTEGIDDILDLKERRERVKQKRNQLKTANGGNAE
jgi:chromosome segregation ATPase